MVKLLPVPTIQPGLFDGYTISFIEKVKGVENKHTLFETDREKAVAIWETKYCQWVLQPLNSWCKQQEHLASVQMFTYSGRKDPICKLAKLIRTYLDLPVVTKVQTAILINDRALLLLAEAMPGRSSKYYQHSVEIKDLLLKFADNIINAPISGQALAAEIPFS